MTWLPSEYLLKGIFLGLLLFAALCAGADPWAAARVGLWLVGGLAIGLTIAAVRKFREGFRVAGRPLTFILFLLLENPTLVYSGSILGLAAGALSIRPDDSSRLLFACLGGGAALGLGLMWLRMVPNALHRLVIGLVAAAALVGAAVFALEQFPDFVPEASRRTFGVFLLLGLPFFYLLTFAGEAEESEVEVAAWCGALAVAIWLIKPTPDLPLLGLIIPAAIYYVYSRRVLPGLRVFKHALRGFSYARLGRYRQALTALRRAVQLDPNNRLARETMWDVHRALQPAAIAADPHLLKLVDPYLCLDRAAALLNERPNDAQMAEATHLLDLVAGQDAALLPRVEYWRSVAATHARRFADAATALTRVLDPAAWPADDPVRKSVLLQAWQLALTLHPELNRRVGTPQLAQPGRRQEAIAAVERALSQTPDAADAWTLKRLLYSGLTEADYENGPVAEFDHSYAQQLGLALVNDSAQWRRGVEYLRIALRGLPQNGPSISQQVAQACERAGDADGARKALEAGKLVGLAIGPKVLADDERQTFYAVVKRLAEDAQARGDLATAVANYQLYTGYERSGIETYRLLADLYEKQSNPLAALRVNEQALVYNAKDKDLLERRDRYYYSVLPEHLQGAPDSYKQAVDVGYCVRKARQLLNTRDADLDLLDWAQHLGELILVLRPDHIGGRVLLARAKLRRGERDEAVALLEAVYKGKPESFASDEEQDDWYLCCRMLGDLYLSELGQPERAVECFTAFRTSAKSGADTLFKLGEAYEQLGQAKKAAKYYEQVTAYDGHPLAGDARVALMRVKA
jgi:tetratricopeptide (TPR) repeat protein